MVWPTVHGEDGRLKFKGAVDVRDVVLFVRNDAVRRAGERLAAMLIAPDVPPPTAASWLNADRPPADECREHELETLDNPAAEPNGDKS